VNLLNIKYLKTILKKVLKVKLYSKCKTRSPQVEEEKEEEEDITSKRLKKLGNSERG